MADSKITFILAAIDRGASKAAKAVGKSLDGMATSSKRSSGAMGNLKLGMLAVAKVGALALVTAVTAVTAAMAVAIKGAVEEEKGIARLNAALKANVKGWDGNIAAVEKVVDARMKLAFTDDELRQSLGTLVVGLGDVDKALAQQALAMDLARLKNISLDEASKLLIRAQNGNTRALKELGIVLPKTASATEILAAIQTKAGGQAEAYGKTTAGAFLKFQIAMGELLEDVAVLALPILTKLAGFLSDNLIPAVSSVIETIKKWVAVIRGNADAMNFLRAMAAAITTAFNILATAIGAVVGAVVAVVGAIQSNKAVMDALRVLAGRIAGAFGGWARSIEFVITKIMGLIKWVKDAIDWLGKLARLESTTGTKLGGLGGKVQVPARAAGGPTVKGKTYLIGEQGPELWRASGTGNIVPNNQLAAGSGGLTVNVNYSPMMSTASPNEARTFVRGIIPELQRELRRLGA